MNLKQLVEAVKAASSATPIDEDGYRMRTYLDKQYDEYCRKAAMYEEWAEFVARHAAEVLTKEKL